MEKKMELAKDVSLQEFCEEIKQAYIGNNHIYKVEVAFDDGTGPLRMVYTTPKGFEQDQMQRKGTIELLLR